jgi:alkanesulfonate monooxygenase
MLTPTGTFCEDAWLTTAALLGETERIKFLVAFRPGFVSPTLAAQMASTYQRMSGGRLLLNVVTGADIHEPARFGDWLEHDARYERAAEFLEILRGAWSGVPFDRQGEHYRVQEARRVWFPTRAARLLRGCLAGGGGGGGPFGRRLSGVG